MSEPRTVQVAVCVVSADPALADCLQALAAAGVTPVVVAGGLDARATADLEARVAAATPGATILHEPLPGRAQARNRALAASDAQVIAYVDADVAVGEGWWPALQRAWEGAAPELAALGGPIRVHFTGGRPRWLGDGLLGALGLLDYGDRPVELDPLARTLMGGNLSFRADALRGVGGFWPARGRDDQLDWFSDEHHAQRELARVGWRAAYDPDLDAARVVRDAPTVRALVRRRLRYGARLALVGDGRPSGSALRKAAKGAAGAGLALARGRRALAVERAARAAENAGVLLAPGVAGDDFQPVAPATPFRHTVPVPRPPADRSRPPSDDGAVVLLYHRVATPDSDPLGLCVSPENFAQHVEVLRRAYTPVPLADLAECVRRGAKPPRDWVAVTFDDGYEDNRAALAALAAAGIPATLFVSTGHVEEGHWFWWDELDVALRGADGSDPKPLEVEIGGSRRAWAPATAGQRAAVRAHLHAWLAAADPREAASAAAAVRRWAGITSGEVPPDGYRPMTVAELRDAAALPGVEIGAHTRNHPSLAQGTEQAATDEIAASRADLERWLGTAPASFSYPFGIPSVDFTAETRRAVAAAGFTQAVSNAPGRATEASELYALPRNVVPDCDGERFERWLATASAPGPPIA
jgi:peptidoglycan/xylan/chitin deacetylase (PgdA/CDA1 family)